MCEVWARTNSSASPKHRIGKFTPATSSNMHKLHIDKKGKMGYGSVATQTSTACAPKDHAINEAPGILEEGKIFFFYR